MLNNLFQLTGVDLVMPTKGLEGAKSFPLGSNCRVPLFDEEKDIFYIKSTDANGFPSIKMYEFKEKPIIDETQNPSVSLDDIRSLIREELGSIKEDLVNAQQPVSTNDNTTNIQHGNPNSTGNKHNSSKPKWTNYSKQQQSGTNSSVVGSDEKQQKPAAADEPSNE